MEIIIFLHIQGDSLIESINQNEVTNPHEICQALINYIREHPQDFQLGEWVHANRVAGTNPP